MAYVIWKIHRGYGPYAYLRESVRVDGKVRARHICYLGRYGGEDAAAAQASDALWPGSVVTTPHRPIGAGAGLQPGGAPAVGDYGPDPRSGGVGDYSAGLSVCSGGGLGHYGTGAHPNGRPR